MKNKLCTYNTLKTAICKYLFLKCHILLIIFGIVLQISLNHLYNNSMYYDVFNKDLWTKVRTQAVCRGFILILIILYGYFIAIQPDLSLLKCTIILCKKQSMTIVFIQKFIVVYGGNLSEERFSPIPLSKDFYLVFRR